MGHPTGSRLNRDAVARWLWHGGSAGAKLARTALLPLAGAHATWMRSRAWAYARGIVAPRDAGVPVIAIGNLSVGATGKTPLVSWVAAYCQRLGVRPGIVLRGYGGDETIVHRERLPEAIVVASRDRYRAARSAIARGAAVVVLDDGFQRLDLARQLNVLLVSAESMAASRWPLPAGPWREAWEAARRADMVVVTRKIAPEADVRGAVTRLRHLGLAVERIAMADLQLARLTELDGGRAVPLARLSGARVLAACAIGDPDAFARQLARHGAAVRLASWSDHHKFTRGDVTQLADAGADVDYVVVTHKDAVKLAGRWPHTGPTVLTAHLEAEWPWGSGLLPHLISDLLTRYYEPVMYSAS